MTALLGTALVAGVLVTAPILLRELSLGPWMTVKGFDGSARLLSRGAGPKLEPRPAAAAS